MRRRPVGAVIADICRDLGITPGHLDRAFWDELSHAIIAYGGSLAGFLDSLNRRLFAFGSGDHSDRADPGWPAAPPRSAGARHRPALNAKQEERQKAPMNANVALPLAAPWRPL